MRCTAMDFERRWQRMRLAVALLYGAVAFLAVIVLSGCATRTVTRHEIVEAPIAVATSCVDAAGRPSVPPALRERYTPQQWAALPPGAKAKAVEAQAGRRLNYEDEDRAATAGCR